MRRSATLLFALLLGLATPGILEAENATNPDSQEPEFRVEKTTVDLGTIKAGDEGIATFVFHNTSDKDVKIIRAKPT